jgi:hypothetical protein
LRRGIQIVFMFDEFEEMLGQLPVKFFHTLRGLRDANKQLLSYLTFTRAPLPVIAERLSISALDIEPFVELFTDNVCYVGPYNDADAAKMIDNLIHRAQKSYSQETIRFLTWATGRYAGLLRAGFRLLESVGNVESAGRTDEELVEYLVSKLPVRQECRTVWTSLTPSEQYVLKAVARLSEYTVNPETEQAVNMLIMKRLLVVDKTQQALDIFPPLFRAFVATNPDV